MDSCIVFDKPLDQRLRFGSDVAFWGDVFRLLAESERVYAERLQMVVNFIGERINCNELKELLNESDDFNKLLQNANHILSCVINKQRNATVARETHLKEAGHLQSFKVNEFEKLDIKIKQKTHTDLKAAFKKKETSTEHHRLTYNEAMLKTESLELHILVGSKHTSLPQLQAKLRKAELKAQESAATYKDSIRKAENQLILLKSAAKQYQDAWRQAEIKAVAVVMETMDNYLQTNSSKNGDTLQFNAHENIDIQTMVADLEHKEYIPAFEFEEYKKPMLKLVKSKLNKQVICKDGTDMSEQSGYDLRLVKQCYVTRPFKATSQHCLSLKKGMKITELIPPTSKGWAFGDSRKTIKSVPQFGFYNIRCVEYF